MNAATASTWHWVQLSPNHLTPSSLLSRSKGQEDLMSKCKVQERLLQSAIGPDWEKSEHLLVLFSPTHYYKIAEQITANGTTAWAELPPSLPLFTAMSQLYFAWSDTMNDEIFCMQFHVHMKRPCTGDATFLLCHLENPKLPLWMHCQWSSKHNGEGTAMESSTLRAAMLMTFLLL